MNFCAKKNLQTALLVGGLIGSAQVGAAVIVLDFEGIGGGAAINNFYNGGTDSLGNSGTNYGIAFGSDAVGVIDIDAGGNGNFANEPSASTVMFFATGPAVLNYASGFDTGFSFYYSSEAAATVNVYDGLNATGTLLGSLNLVAQFNANGCTGDPNGTFCNWTPVGVSFAGIAKSIDFGGTVDQAGFDDITFGSATAGGVPEPATLALFAAGLAGFGVRRKRNA